MLNWQLTLKALARERWLYGLWILSLALAVTGLLIVDVFRGSFSQTLKVQGQKILTADLSLSVRRPFTDTEVSLFQKTLSANAKTTRMTEMYAMVSHRSHLRPTTHLSAVRFIEDDYPLVGDLLIESAGQKSQRYGRDFLGRPGAWISADLIPLLRVKEGDLLKIGDVDFIIMGCLRKDSSQTFRLGTMAPRIYVHRQFLPSTRLVQFGSTFSDTLLALSSVPTRLLKEKVEATFADPTLQVTTPQDLEQGSFRVISRLLDFLGLSGLITLCLGWIAVYYLGRRWLNLESPAVGILKCLGYSASQIQQFLLQKLTLIMFIGVLAGAAIAWLGAQAVLPMVRESLPEDFRFVWSWSSTSLLVLAGPTLGLLLIWPAVRGVASESPLNLIHSQWTFRTSNLDVMAFACTTAALFFLLTLNQARSWQVTFIFLGGLLGTIILVILFSFLLLRGLESLRRNTLSWPLYLTLALWSRRKSLATLLITVSALSGLLAQLVPHIEKTLVGEIQTPLESVRPSLFMIDIQDDQLPAITDFLKTLNIEASQTAPFIRARILQVNGTNFERTQAQGWTTREAETDTRFRNRGVNLSYRDQLGPAEKIVQGKPWSEMSRDFKHAEISLEVGYAERLKLKIGDILRFDLQGVEFNATVVNLREVNWNTFEPNFFITFPAQVIEESPKTWILTLRRNQNYTPAEIQALLAVPFPNVTSINVQEALNNATEVLAKLSGGLRIASNLCLALGIFVFLMILLFQMAAAQKDAVQLKIIGAKNSEILLLQLSSYGGLCILGLLFGSLMSLAVGWGLAHFGFGTRFIVDWKKMVEIFFLSSSLAVLGMISLAWIYKRRAKLNLLVAE